MDKMTSELVSLRKNLDDHYLRDYYGLPIEDDSVVAGWLQQHDMLASEIGRLPYREPQKHWS